jgi:class 3 adenylate cyclase/tetratricopeptide (TPR) repeat protein
MKCSRCQQDNAPQARFCVSCGANLAIACRSCGTELPGGARFCPQCGQAVAAGPAPSPSPETYTPRHLAEKILTSRAALEGERKQVTVLFADVKSSMELLVDRDPEETRTILDPVLEWMMEAVHHYEGTVNQVMGDGIMALFGAPLAHEDHAVRACYAALRMQESMRKYADEVRRSHAAVVKIRVGLNSGTVVVRAIGTDLHMDYAAVGQTTHLAARMEQLADPGAIVITPDTLALAEGYVEVKSLGPVPVKGLANPVEVYEVTGAGPARTRLQAAARRGLTRFVGRDAELEQLRHAQERASTGQGQVAAIVGEAGVGKSRLVYEFTHSHRLQGWLVLESASVSYGKAMSYVPLIDLLKGYFKIQNRDDLREIREKVTGKLLTLDESLKAALPALLALLGAPVDDVAWRALDPDERRRQTFAAVRQLLLREAQEQPLLLIFEDLHWVDSETQALLDSLVDSLGSAPVLLLVNYRTEFQHAWGSKAHYSQLRLDALPAESAGELLDALLGEDPGLAPLKLMLVKRGNPFFLEETVRTLVETKALIGERGRYRLAQPVQAIQVPPTVQAMLAARVDRLLPEDKRLLQIASVVGKDVPFALLQSVADLPDEALRSGLDHLQAAEFLYETRLFPDHEYTFKHALTHEVTYASLLHERRRTTHARIVEAVEALHAGRLIEHVERLGHHAVQGEMWGKALHYLQQAGLKALDRSAYREAVGYYEQALEVLPHLPQTRDTREQAIDLRLALRSALLPSGDSARILARLREAEALAVALDDPRRLGQISGFLSVHFRNRGAYDEANAAARRALTLGTNGGDIVLQALANLFLGATCWAQGHYRRAMHCLGQTMAALDGPRQHERFGQANLPAVQARAFLAACHAELGSFAEGNALGEEGLQIAGTAKHPSSLMWADYGLGLLALRQGHLPRALARLERAMGIGRDVNLPLFVPRMAAALGEAYELDGRAADATPLLTRALEQTTAPEMIGFQALCRLPLGEAQLVAGRFEEAHAHAERALAIARAHQERGNEAYALKLLGEIALRRDPSECEQAEDFYRQAMALATELEMHPLLAHCHRGLGQLFSKTGERRQAENHLTTAATMYRAMGMALWLEQTEAAMGRASAWDSGAG